MNDNSGTYSDMELSATVDVTKGLGLSIGWRRLETDIRIKRDFGDLRFQGIWCRDRSRGQSSRKSEVRSSDLTSDYFEPSDF